MVQFFGRTETTDVQNGQLMTVFRIPAFSETTARRRAQINIRAKDLEDASIDSIDNVSSTDVPGQNIYDVTVSSER